MLLKKHITIFIAQVCSLFVCLGQSNKIESLKKVLPRLNAAMINDKSAEKNKSMGVKITTERLALLSRNEDEQAVFDIEDLTDKEGNAAGTKVILKMKNRKLVDVLEHQKQ